MTFDQLKDHHKGEVIHVIGASEMMDKINPSFFDNVITVGVNFAYKNFNATYTISRHWKVIEQWKGVYKPDSMLLHPEWTCDLGGFWIDEIGTYFYDANRVKPDYLYRSRGIMGTALSFARWLGAKQIVIWGVECNNKYMNGYDCMKDEQSAQVFMDTNDNNVTIINEYNRLKYGVETIWM